MAKEDLEPVRGAWEAFAVGDLKTDRGRSLLEAAMDEEAMRA
jgi:hypothetical protein